ncbi:hypothetical protein [Isoptericola jiangsuensis]|nr:hypothetical protein [Isoptericola jiangsuensis]
MAWAGSGMMLAVVLEALVPVVTAVAVVVIAATLSRGARPTAPAEPTDRPGLLEQRLEHLDWLHAAGRITDDERGAARARLLGTV